MDTMHPLHAVIEAYNDAWNRHDVDAIVATHTEDSVFRNHTGGGEAVGRAAIRRIVAGVFDTFPDIHFTLRRLYVRDDLIVQEWTATATHHHPVMYNDTTLEPTGRAIRWDGMDIIPMRDGQVARKDVYAESLSYLRQLGAPL
jgi:steroid delta-isomerase-like uncharacterized protein